MKKPPKLLIPDKSPFGTAEVNGKELNYHLGKTYISMADLQRNDSLEEAEKYMKLAANNF